MFKVQTHLLSVVQGEPEVSAPAGGRRAGIHWKEVQQEQRSGRSALQRPERSCGDPQELQPREDQTQFPGEFTTICADLCCVCHIKYK